MEVTIEEVEAFLADLDTDLSEFGFLDKIGKTTIEIMTLVSSESSKFQEKAQCNY
jgi:hypothetical protein